MSEVDLTKPLPLDQDHISWWFHGHARRWLANLEWAGIETIQDLMRATDAELLAIPGIGKKALAELREVQHERAAVHQELQANA